MRPQVCRISRGTDVMLSGSGWSGPYQGGLRDDQAIGGLASLPDIYPKKRQLRGRAGPALVIPDNRGHGQKIVVSQGTF